MENSQIVPIIIAIVAATPGIFALISESRKVKVDAQKVAQEAAVEIINPLREEMKLLRIRVSELETLVKAKDERITELERCLIQRDHQIADRDIRIDDLETEVADLRLRLDAVEKHNGNGGANG
jgi:uncharacterized protein (DUF3084 family)